MPAKAPVFWKLVSAALFGLTLCAATWYRNQKAKEDFVKLTSKITFLADALQVQGHLNPNKEPVRYLKVADYPKYFKLFIGEDLDGSKPNFQQVDNLKVGDVVTVYYDENLLSSDNIVSRLAYFIDKDGKPYFIRGLNNNMSYILATCCLIIIATSYFLKKSGRIL